MGRVAIKGARLLDGRGGAQRRDVVFVTEGDRIAFVGAAEDAPLLGDVVIDAPGTTLIPGLIDCHVHLCFDGEPDFRGEARELTDVSAALKATRNARRALEAGITTVRDLGGHALTMLEVARARRAGLIDGARIVTAGAVLTITGGHGHFIGFEVDSADELVKGIRALVKAGADVVKIMSTGGVLTPGIGAQRASYTSEQLAIAVAEAHEAGLRVATHSIGATGILNSLRAGVDSVEHGCYLTDEALTLLVQNQSWLVATLSAPERILHGGEGIPDYALAKSTEIGSAHRASFRRAVDAGVRIASGTDAGTPFNFHGGLWRELELMHSAGMPLDRLLVAATCEAAALVEVDAGVLEAGKIADAVLLDGDPLTDVSAYRRVKLVVQDGRVVVDRR